MKFLVRIDGAEAKAHIAHTVPTPMPRCKGHLQFFQYSGRFCILIENELKICKIALKQALQLLLFVILIFAMCCNMQELLLILFVRLIYIQFHFINVNNNF